jgi:hypothetical protein
MMVCVQRCGRRLSRPVSMYCSDIHVDRLKTSNTAEILSAFLKSSFAGTKSCLVKKILKLIKTFEYSEICQ